MSASLALPMSAHELRDAVRCVRAFDPARLDRILRADVDRGLLEVQAGVTWASLAAHAGAPFLAAWPDGASTVGRSAAENVPGPDGHPVVKHIEAMTLVTADGELRRVSRDASPELFRLCVGGHGVFGPAYSITLRLASLEAALAGAKGSVALSLPGQQDGSPIALLLPPGEAERFLGQARDCLREWRVEIAGAEASHVLPEAETFLRWANREYALVSLRLGAASSLCGAVRSTQVRRLLIDLAIACGGSFSIASTPDATRAQVETCYPMMGAFLAEKRRLDPAGRLSNAWYRHYRGLVSRGSCAVRWSA